MGYDPELDISFELEPDAASYFLTIISVHRWMIELGMIDIITKVLLLSSHLALSKVVHLNTPVHVMACLGQRYYSRLVYDTSYQEINHSVFKKCDLSKFNQDSEETIPMNAPELLSNEVDIHRFVGSADQEVDC